MYSIITTITVHPPLLGFAGERVHVGGYIYLLSMFGTRDARRSITVRYVLVDVDTSYNIIIDMRTLNQLVAAVSTPLMAMKFPGEGEVSSPSKSSPRWPEHATPKV